MLNLTTRVRDRFRSEDMEMNTTKYSKEHPAERITSFTKAGLQILLHYFPFPVVHHCRMNPFQDGLHGTQSRMSVALESTSHVPSENHLFSQVKFADLFGIWVSLHFEE